MNSSTSTPKVRCAKTSSGRLRNFLLAVVDSMTLFLVWAVVVWAYRASGLGYYEFGASFYLTLWPAVLAYVVMNALFRLYHGNVFHPAAPVDPIDELRRLVGSSAILHLSVLAALALMYKTTEQYSRAVIVISGFLTALLAQPARDLFRILAKRLGFAQIPVVVIGGGENVARIKRFLQRDAYTGFEERPDADMAVVCCGMDRFKSEVPDLFACYTHIEFLPEATAFPTYGAQAISFDGIGGIEMVNQRRMKVLRMEKSLLDIVLAAVAFVLLLPFFVVIPVLVKLTSKGPVFYRQKRLGKNGRQIYVWKFRSMYVDADDRLKLILDSDPLKKAEWEANFKLSQDPRITPFGRFLRKTSIDEFPQLFNVFTGDMALVGPRPIVENEIPHYGDSYSVFSSVKPGITGLWQASGRSDTGYARRVALDVHYVMNWSPWMDIWILFRTVYAVVFMRGAR